MSIYEYDEEKHIQQERDEYWEKGKKFGEEIGWKAGKEQIDRQREQLNRKDEQLNQKDEQLNQKDQEIKALRRLLAEAKGMAAPEKGAQPTDI